MRLGSLAPALLAARPPTLPLYGVARVRGFAASAASDDGGAQPPSVTGVIYANDGPTVRLFTKHGCTLCDKAKDVLAQAAAERPHTLESVDITDADKAHWWAKYKYDIPVLHIDGSYWAKHRITLDGALDALATASEGAFEAQRGEPDASRLERPR